MGNLMWGAKNRELYPAKEEVNPAAEGTVEVKCSAFHKCNPDDIDRTAFKAWESNFSVGARISASIVHGELWFEATWIEFR